MNLDTFSRSWEMTQDVKAPTANPDCLSSTPGTHVEEGENDSW